MGLDSATKFLIDKGIIGSDKDDFVLTFDGGVTLLTSLLHEYAELYYNKHWPERPSELKYSDYK